MLDKDSVTSIVYNTQGKNMRCFMFNSTDRPITNIKFGCGLLLLIVVSTVHN